MKTFIVFICLPLCAQLVAAQNPAPLSDLSGAQLSKTTTQAKRDSSSQFSEGPVIDVRLYGATGDNVTDDGPAFRACLNATASVGKTCLAPATCGESGCFSYYVGTADATGFGMTVPKTVSGVCLSGTGNSYAGGGTRIRFAAGMGGIHFLAPPGGGPGGCMEHISLYSPDFDLNTPPTWGVPGTHHGIWIEGSKPYLNNVFVQGFNGDGILIDSSASFAPDLCVLMNVSAYDNKGNGIHLLGKDANVCGLYNPNVRLNQLWGIKLENEFGGTIISPHADANHHDTMSNLSTKIPLKKCQRAGDLTTCTTGTKHSLFSGDNVYQSGCADPSFNGPRWRISATGPAAYTYRIERNESTTGGTVDSGPCAAVQYSVNGRIWSSNSLDGGPYFSTYNAVLANTWVGIYTEGGTADQLSLISNNDTILQPSAWIGNRPEQAAGPAGLTSIAGATAPPFSYTQTPGRFVAPHPSSVNPATGLAWNARWFTGAATNGPDAAWGFSDASLPGNSGSWMRTSGTGQKLGGCSSSNNGYGNVLGQWGFRMNSATDNDSCVATPFWITEFNTHGLGAASFGLPNGYYIGSLGQGSLRNRNLGSTVWKSGTQSTGDQIDRVLLASGGFYGWLCIKAGSPCSSAKAWGPIADDQEGNSWTLPQLTLSKLIVKGDAGLTGAPRMTYSAFIPSLTSAPGTYARLIPEKGITVTRLQMVLGTAGVSCTRQASLAVTDGTTSQILTTSNGVSIYDSGVISKTFPAGAAIDVRIDIPAENCGSATAPLNANLTVEYRMD